MSLRHEDDLPPLTPAQQAEVIRLAARLQAEHEGKEPSESLFAAAEEAGIQRRFVEEAVGKLPIEPWRGFSAWDLALTASPLVFVLPWWPLQVLGVTAGLGTLLAALPAARETSRSASLVATFTLWLLFDVAFIAYNKAVASGMTFDPLATFETLGFQLAASFLSVGYARFGIRLVRTLAKRPILR